MYKTAILTIALFAALGIPARTWAAGPVNFTGSGSGRISNVKSGTLTACDDTSDCTETFSGPVNFDGATKGTLLATLTVGWSGKHPPNPCVPASGTGKIGALAVTISGNECETSAAAGASSMPHAFRGTIFAQGPSGTSTLIIVADAAISDSGTGTGTFRLGATGVFQKVSGTPAVTKELDAVDDGNAPTGFSFQPKTLTVPQGATLLFKNKSMTAPHNVTLTDSMMVLLPTINPGDHESTKVSLAPGTYNFFCSIHGINMSGTLKVTP